MMADTMDHMGEYVLAFVRESHLLHYVASICKRGTLNFYYYLLGHSQKNVENPYLHCSSIETHQSVCWKSKLCILILKFLVLIERPVAFSGACIEFFLNYLHINGGFIQILRKAIFDRASLVRPPVDQFYSFIGFLDLQQDLHRGYEELRETGKKESHSSPYAITGDLTWRNAANLCVMASKLAYENEHIVQRIVTDSWKMHFVKFYDCWNEYLHCNTTQAFLISNRESDADVVVLAFRGTSPFDVHDWCTDFDFSWYGFPLMGKVHAGFLEALGLGSRSKVETFHAAKQNASMKAERLVSTTTPTSGLPDSIMDDSSKVLAFDTISSDIKEFLRANLGAKLFITGHSLGGALAVLFSAMLLLEKDYLILPRLEAIFTFGQPRVADNEFAKYMESRLCSSGSQHGKYFRVVYGDDIVPRVPFDNRLFMFKHFGLCHYYRSVYQAMIMPEEPGKYFFLLFYPSSYIYAIKDLFSMIYYQFVRGGEYRESGLCMLCRCIGIFLPGLACHNPANYVNSIRFGPSPFSLQLNKFKEDKDK